MASFDDSSDTGEWLASMQKAEIRRLRRTSGWTPSWAASSTSATSAGGGPELMVLSESSVQPGWSNAPAGELRTPTALEVGAAVPYGGVAQEGRQFVNPGVVPARHRLRASTVTTVESKGA